jgi:hypothetical protein
MGSTLATALVAWMAQHPADYFYAAVYRPLIIASIVIGCLWLFWIAMHPRLESEQTKKRLASVALFLALAVGLTYGFSLSFGFIREDIVFVRAPSWSQTASALTGSWLNPNPFLLDYYRPLVILSYAAEFPLFGTWAPGYHLTNLLLLTGCGLGLYALAFRLVPNARLALVVALWFILHPYNYVTASWISARTDTLALLFYLGAVLLWPKRPLWGLLSATGAIMSKEMAVTVPLILLLLDVTLPGRKNTFGSFRDVLRRYLPLLLLWFTYLVFLWWRFPEVRVLTTSWWNSASRAWSWENSIVLRLLGIEGYTLFAPFAGWLRGDMKWLLLVPAGLLTSIFVLTYFPHALGNRSRLTPGAGKKVRRLMLVGILWITLASLPILNKVGFEFHRMGPLLAVGASLTTLGVLYMLSRVGRGRVLGISVAAMLTLWLGAMVVEDTQGVLDQHPYAAWVASESARNYRHWAPYLPEESTRLLRLKASGRLDHRWPIYRSDPPP